MTTSRTITRLGFAALACAPLSVALGEGSEFPDGSVTITTLPFLDIGDTSNNAHDFDAACPWNSDAPDVFYTYVVPPDVTSLRITLCESSYDTKLYVLDGDFQLVVCDDDGCTTSGAGFQSWLEPFDVTPGKTYHIAVDGWSDASGVYELLVESLPPPTECIFGGPAFFNHCLPGSLIENEPCPEGFADDLNRGCDTAGGPQFTNVECGDRVCGQLSSISGYHDVDAYELTTYTADRVRLTMIGEMDLHFGLMDDGPCFLGDPQCDCIPGNLSPSRTIEPCELSHLDPLLVAGRHWWLVSSAVAGAVPCDSESPGNEYVAWWTCAMYTCCDMGDTDENGTIDFDDFLTLLSNWGECATPSCCPLGDTNADGTIGFADVINMLADWGPCPRGF